jgi:hypothetical protein
MNLRGKKSNQRRSQIPANTLGMVYEARGDNQKAADCYRKVIDFIRPHPDDYHPGFEPPQAASSQLMPEFSI